VSLSPLCVEVVRSPCDERPWPCQQLLDGSRKALSGRSFCFEDTQGGIEGTIPTRADLRRDQERLVRWTNLDWGWADSPLMARGLSEPN